MYWDDFLFLSPLTDVTFHPCHNVSLNDASPSGSQALVLIQCASDVLQSVRGEELQEAHSKDEGGMERRSVEKGISSGALCSVSPTCRARWNHFSIHPPLDFLSNVISFSLVCLCLSRSVSLSDSCFSPLTYSSSFLPSFLSILPSVPISVPHISFSSPAQLWAGSCFIVEAHRDPFRTSCARVRTHTHTHTQNTDYSAAAVKLSLTLTDRNITINQRSSAESQAELAVQLLSVTAGVRWERTKSWGPFKHRWTVPSCCWWAARTLFGAPLVTPHWWPKPPSSGYSDSTDFLTSAGWDRMLTPLSRRIFAAGDLPPRQLAGWRRSFLFVRRTGVWACLHLFSRWAFYSWRQVPRPTSSQ